MVIKALTYQDTELWQNVAQYAEACSRETTGKYLSEQMKNNAYSDWERVFVALVNDSIAGFCALTKKCSLQDIPYFPYIGFVFVGEDYRGNRISENLCLYAIKYAKSVGFDKVYLYSDLVNFYEKYGFIKIDEKIAPWGSL